MFPPGFKELCEELGQKWQVAPYIHPDDFIFQFLINNPIFPTKEKAIEYYFEDGANSARKLASILKDICGFSSRRIDLLEFASGYGCVSRHLKNAIPQCTVTACDIHQEAITFTQEKLGVDAVLSAHAPEDLRFAGKFDVVFALSFFSHMPKGSFHRWLKTLASFVKPNGFLIFTTHGLVTRKASNMDFLFDRDGFHFMASSEQKNLDSQENGSSVVLPQYVFNRICDVPGVVPVFFQEGYWWGHQDVYIVKSTEEQLIVSSSETSRAVSAKTIRRLMNDGERVTHLRPDDCYHAHLSIYHFALPYISDKLVLDAGSGSGYGSAYLADHGARAVVGVDIDEDAVSFSKSYFNQPNLSYQHMNLEKITGFPEKHFDVVFSSNVLEHVPNVINFFKGMVQLIKPDGLFVLAVPPVVDENSRNANLDNVFHLNIWTPRQWHHVLSQFFEEIECYAHRFEVPGQVLDFSKPPEQTVINETDFNFPAVSLDDLYQPTLTSIYIARKPRQDSRYLASIHKPTFVDDSFTRSFQDANQRKRDLSYLVAVSMDVLKKQGFRAFLRKVRERLLKS